MVEQWISSTTLVVDLDRPYKGRPADLATEQLAAPAITHDCKRLTFTVVPGVQLNDLPSDTLVDAGGSSSRYTLLSDLVIRLMGLGYINEE